MSILKTLLSVTQSVVCRMYEKKDQHRLNAAIERGLRLGKNVHINHGVMFDHTYPYLIEIGDECRVAEGVRFLTHDATTFFDLGVTRIAPIKILEGSFIGERATILPGVTIGPRALIAAGAVVNMNIGPDMMAAGNPARPCGRFPDLLKRHRKMITKENHIDICDLENGKITPEDIRHLFEEHSTLYVCGWPSGGGTARYINTDREYVRAMVERGLKSVWTEKENEQ